MALVTFPISNKGDWLAMRRRDVTASEVAALFGKHPYRTARQVYFAKKVNGDDQGDNSAKRRGRILQPAVAEGVREERPQWEITEFNSYYRDTERRIGATPDFQIEAAPIGTRPNFGVLETKTANPRIFEEHWSGGPPIAWVLQTLVQMMLTDAQWGAIACLVTSQDFPVHIYEVSRHPAAEAAIIAAVADFWRMVERGTPPPADYSRDGIDSMFPRDLSGDNELPKWLVARTEAAAIIKNMEVVRAAADSEIKAKLGKLGENEIGICGGYRITWKMQHRKETIIPAKDFRVLRINCNTGD